ncbi:hypothetical protein ACE1XZ_22455, partial [Bacillus subtilis]|uniref:hypothetical protein n=1 Tax=Bacillus subtilis TaxID=1423 RepID=UPI0035BF03F8
LEEVTALEGEGGIVPDARILASEEPSDDQEAPGENEAVEAVAPTAPELTMSAEEAIAALRGKIDRLGPVNMMAIEQFDELEARHTFLTTQRGDLVESIALTSEAIKRIDETTRHRFLEAFAVINRNFQ